MAEQNSFWIYLIGSSVISAFVAGAFALWAARTNSEPNKQKAVTDAQTGFINEMQEERSLLKQQLKDEKALTERQRLYIERLKHHMGALELRLMVNEIEVPPRPKMD